MIGIDFTLSNGQPLNKDSLHHVDKADRSILNAYAEAIISVADILGPYCGGYSQMVTLPQASNFHSDFNLSRTVLYLVLVANFLETRLLSTIVSPSQVKSLKSYHSLL